MSQTVHGQCESSTPAPPETVTPTDQSDPVTPPDYEDEPVVVYPPPPVQTSPKPSLGRSSRIRRPPDRYGDPVAHLSHMWTCDIHEGGCDDLDCWHCQGLIISRPWLSMFHDLDCLAVTS